MTKETAEEVVATVIGESQQLTELGAKIDAALNGYNMNIIVPALCFVLAAIAQEIEKVDGWTKEAFMEHILGTFESAYEYRNARGQK